VKNPRDHGLGDSPKVIGTPKLHDRVPGDCPHCHCDTLFRIEVEVEPPPLLRRPADHKAVGTYIGCPACPWASPMMISAVPVPKKMTPEEAEAEARWHSEAATKARARGDEVSAQEHAAKAAQLRKPA